MHVAGMSLPLVFAAGVVSFISPCVLPLVPGYLSTISGVALEEMSERGPCVGRILATVLTLAGANGSLRTGVLLLAVYGLGLAAPFVLVGFGFARALAAFKRLQHHYQSVELVAGLLLVGMGGLLLSGYLFLLNIYAQEALAWLHLDWWSSV